MDWIVLVDDRDRLWCYVIEQINFRVLNCKKFLEYYGLFILLETTLLKLVKRLKDTWNETDVCDSNQYKLGL